MAVLAARTNHQRQEIAAKYQQEHDKVIINEHVTSNISYEHFVNRWDMRMYHLTREKRFLDLQ